jgi:RNA polymerase sigma-70 factor, ECF subfamily
MRKGPVRQADAARLLMKHHLSLYCYVFACVRNHHDTEDILQEVSVAVIESIGELRDEAGFLPWAREIARRRVLAHVRKARREQALDPEIVQRLAEAAEALEAADPVADHHEALLRCLEGLPESSRQVLLMRYDGSAGNVQGMASHLGRSVQSVYAQIKRIKAALRDCVRARLAGER